MNPNHEPRELEQWLRKRIASHLNVDEDKIEVESPFTRFGIDSVEALSITVELEDWLNVRLASTVVWDYPTIAKLARYLATGVGSTEVVAPASAVSGPEAIDPSLYDVSRFDEYRNLRLRLRLAQVSTVGNPYFKLTTGVSSDVVTISEREYLNYGTYNYLGLSGHPRLIEAAAVASRAFGTSSSASRTTSGEKPIHRELESQIAKLLQVDAAVTFVGGHATNTSFIGKFLDARDLVLHDELAHDSVLQGAKLSGAARVPFRHNGVAAVDEFLRERRARYRRVLIVVEGVYSTDGDIAPIRELVEVKRRHGALLMVDEAHSIGVLGARGGGLREHADIAGSDVDVWMGTLSKAFASCGGYIAGSRALVELVKYTSPGFLYSVGMTPANAAMALEAIRLMLAEPDRVNRLRARGEYFRNACARLGLDTGLSKDSAVVPVIVGDSLQCMRLAQSLFRRGINVTPMVHPAVRNDEARLRFFVSAQHSEQQLQATAQATAEEFARIREQYSGSFSRLRSTPVLEPKEAAIAREGFEAFTKGDLSVLAEQLHERAVYFFPGRSPVAGYHEGRDKVLDFFASIFELTDGTLSVHLHSILSNAGHGVLLWHNGAQRDGKRLDGMMCEILDIEGDQVIGATFYASNQGDLDEFLGEASRVPAVPRNHMRTGAPDDNAMATFMGQLLRGEALDSDFEATLAPELSEDGVAHANLPLARVHQQLTALSRAGRRLTLDFAVQQEDVGVARVLVTDSNGVVASICIVADWSDGKAARAWLASDCDFHREHGAASNQQGADHESNRR